MSMTLCILGASGIGKSPLDGLLRPGVGKVEPYRARPDGARKGEEYYVNPHMLKELLELNRQAGPALMEVDSDRGNIQPFQVGGRPYRKWLVLFPRASFFQVRGTEQVLL